MDFQPVERVVQIGSAKNLARLLQRSGRSAHRPGGCSEVLFLPTNALELLEVSAMRRGLAAGLVEHRTPPRAPLDVLLQHLTGLACGPGFEPEREWRTVRSCWSYRALSRDDWNWCLRFLEEGATAWGPIRASASWSVNPSRRVMGHRRKRIRSRSHLLMPQSRLRRMFPGAPEWRSRSATG